MSNGLKIPLDSIDQISSGQLIPVSISLSLNLPLSKKPLASFGGIPVYSDEYFPGQSFVLLPAETLDPKRSDTPLSKLKKFQTLFQKVLG